MTDAPDTNAPRSSIHVGPEPAVVNVTVNGAPSAWLWLAQRLDRVIALLEERNALDHDVAEWTKIMSDPQSFADEVDAASGTERPPGNFADYRENDAGDGWDVNVGGSWHPALPSDVAEIERRNIARKNRKR